jgi:hypothetical protein
VDELFEMLSNTEVVLFEKECMSRSPSDNAKLSIVSRAKWE